MPSTKRLSLTAENLLRRIAQAGGHLYFYALWPREKISSHSLVRRGLLIETNYAGPGVEITMAGREEIA